MSEFKFCCPACGQHLTGDDSYVGRQITCPSCRQTITVPVPPPAIAIRPAGIRPSPPPPLSGTQSAPPARTCGLAVASLVCSCAGLLFGFLGTIPGIICGLKALGRIKRTPGLGGKGMAIAGLITGGVLSVLWIPLTFILTVGIISGFRMASQIKARQGMYEQGKGASGTANTDVAADLTPDGSGWLADLEGVSIPDAPVSGRVQGLSFTAKEIEMDPSFGTLEFSYDNSDTTRSRDAFEQIILSLRWDNEHDPGKFSGRTFVVQKDDTISIQPQGDWKPEKPDVRMVWNEPGGKPQDSMRESYKYALRLEFGELKNGKLPGRIYLCVLDRNKSFICGKFVANVDKNSFASPASGTAEAFGRHQRGADAPVDTKPDAAGWMFDLENAVIPDAPVAGRMYGRPFKAQAVELQQVFLTFRQGSLPNQQEFRLMLSPLNPTNPAVPVDLNDPTRLNGQIITVSSSDGQFQRPHLTVDSSLPQDYTSGIGGPDDYVMRLEFGEFKDGKLPGRIYLCALAGGKSFIRGKFEARVVTFPTGATPRTQPPPGFTPPGFPPGHRRGP